MDKFYNLTIPWHKSIDGVDGWQEMRRRQKFARQRIERGFASSDWWNMDGWIENILPEMLRDFADKTCSYPGSKTYDEWVAELRHYADLLEESAKEIEKAYTQEEYHKAQCKREQFFEWFAKNLSALWD